MASKLKTSYKWMQKKHPDMSFFNKNGWDKSNLKFAFFEEKITLQEFEKRYALSGVQKNPFSYGTINF